MSRKNLMSNDDIWNAVVHVLSVQDFPTGVRTIDEAFIVFQFYSELESGGHEMLFNWNSDYIKEVGINNYMNTLINTLEQIGAHDYAAIETNYVEKLWHLYTALENEEIEEKDFYTLIEKADNAYYSLNGKLAVLLEVYFIRIHTELIEVMEE